MISAWIVQLQRSKQTKPASNKGKCWKCSAWWHDWLYLSHSSYFHKPTVVPGSFFSSLVEEGEQEARGKGLTLVPRQGTCIKLGGEVAQGWCCPLGVVRGWAGLLQSKTTHVGHPEISPDCEEAPVLRARTGAVASFPFCLIPFLCGVSGKTKRTNTRLQVYFRPLKKLRPGN